MSHRMVEILGSYVLGSHRPRELPSTFNLYVFPRACLVVGGARGVPQVNHEYLSDDAVEHGKSDLDLLAPLANLPYSPGHLI